MIKLSNTTIYKKIPLICLVLSLAIFVLSMTNIVGGGNLDKAAEETLTKISSKLQVLDNSVNEILAQDPDKPNLLDELDEDIVIYRYVNDSLVSWYNQFPIINDNIAPKVVFHRLSPFDNRLESPLNNVTEELQYINIGTRWYLVKYVEGEWNDKVIAGLEIKNDIIDGLSTSKNGVNPELDLDIPYSIQPLMHPEGTAVSINGVPLFKVTYDAMLHSPILDNCLLRWIAMLIFVIALMLFLAGHRTFKVYFTIVPLLIAIMTTAIIWSHHLSETHQIFSPHIFSDQTFSSLGELLLINLFIFIICVCTFIIKGRISKYIHKNPRTAKRKSVLYGLGAITAVIGIAIYIHLSLTSFIHHSTVSLELYKASDNILYTALVYLSYACLMACIPMLLQEIKPALYEFTGRHYNILTRRNLIIFAFICSCYFTVLTSLLGLKKEQEMIYEWAGAIAGDRDAALESTLKEIEEQIAEDHNIASLIAHKYGESIILNRIKEIYLNQYDSQYEIRVTIIRENVAMEQSLLEEITQNGTMISDKGHFMFTYDKQGHAKYAGVFLYFSHKTGADRLIIQIEPKVNKEGRGYHNILHHLHKVPDINIPSIYSYAKYKKGILTIHDGSFPYPNIPETYIGYIQGGDKVSVYRKDDYVHFIVRTENDEHVIISRPQRTGLLYFTSLSYIFLGLTLLGLLIPTKHNHQKKFRSNYFRTRISIIILASSFLLLSAMAAVSITFVYKRNEHNMYNMMQSRVSTIQGLLESHIRHVDNWEGLSSIQFAALLNDIGNTTKSDITLYTPEGKMFRSTSPEIFEERILSSRIDNEAFHNIQSRSKRFYIQEEEVDGYEYWTLYAPLLNDKGEIIAIMSVPYTDTDYDFAKDSFFHAALIINAFILLLIITLIISNRIINSMFTPLVEMGKKMSGGNINKLEYIIYKRDDEISSLVDAYNRMVKDLSDSTKQLALAERDKAWSEMARQVAHEIKNPLTPIKLEIQRLIRLKQNNNPKWEEKFEQVAAVVLEHIQILADTANEFSTFAKLYTEEPVLIDLDKVLQEQIMLFDNKENIEISYIGLERTIIMGPKPQLIRVFINLLNNAIQAVENQQKEAYEKGETPVDGKIMVCLRHGRNDGFFDITFEDNGPGVSKDHQNRLFTPNFTTKSGGTGLGLAICRNIIEKCEGEISYQKSFALGGACFVVSLPKKRNQRT